MENSFAFKTGEQEFELVASLSGNISSKPLLSPLFSLVKRLSDALELYPLSSSTNDDDSFSLKSSFPISSSSKESCTAIFATFKCHGTAT